MRKRGVEIKIILVMVVVLRVSVRLFGRGWMVDRER
jgi:hypothetical protein